MRERKTQTARKAEIPLQIQQTQAITPQAAPQASHASSRNNKAGSSHLSTSINQSLGQLRAEELRIHWQQAPSAAAAAV